MNSTVALKDGRIVGMRVYGAAKGFPVFFLHGNLNSRMFTPRWDKTEEETTSAGALVYAFDRPGYGLSSLNLNGTYKSFAEDLGQVATHLGIEKFAVLGYSSGGPYALACATTLRERITACGVICGDGPYKYMGEEWEQKVFGNMLHRTDPIGACKVTAEQLRTSYETIANETKRTLALADIEAALAQGYDGPANDSQLETGNWEGVWENLSDISTPVFMWHGTQDESVPLGCSEFLFKHMNPNVAKLNVVEGENHSIIRRKWVEVLETVIAASEPSQLKPASSVPAEEQAGESSKM